MNVTRCFENGKLAEATAEELNAVAGGNSIAILGVPFLIGCIAGDALWGKGTMSMETWFNKYVK